MREGKHVILCIDDDPDFLETIGLILESAGYIVETAPTAEEGLAIYDEVKPDAVLLDMMMEEVDAGTGFVKDLKAKGPTPPIFLLSSVGNGLSANIDTAALGLSGVFQKPIDPDTLTATLKKKLEAS